MKRALLAEDDPTSRAFLSEALTLLGWDVAAFATGEAAAEAAINAPFSVLLLDLNLPGIDGNQTLRRIRNHEQHACADVAALALTADARPELQQRLRRQGFDAVLTKPLSLEHLAHALAGLGLDTDETLPVGVHPDPSTRAVSVPIWDDEAALAALGGNPATLAALRKLMLDDLPTQRARILADPGSRPAREELHRLRAACGFCGAARLALAVERLETTDDASARPILAADFSAAVDDLLAHVMPVR